jgi:UV DNA damage endonuclease
MKVTAYKLHCVGLAPKTKASLMNDIARMGFCCKYLDSAGTTDDKTVNTRGTTVAWLNRQTRDVAEQRLWDIMVHNIEATRRLVQLVAGFPAALRMVRIGSNLLPVYTEPTWGYFWHRADVRAYAERQFAEVGAVARAGLVRLSFHPGQFCVLASDNLDIVRRSMEEFEYHADMARWMGFGQQWQDMKINVHISGRRGPEALRAVYGQLSPEARNGITIENEENTHGLDDCLTLGDLMPIVLDIHHHWVRSGEYIAATDARVARVKDSWRDRRPVLHYSVSSEAVLVGHACDVKPDMPSLLAAGHNRQRLRAHSDFFWNTAVNHWALTFWPDFDIQCEAKAKNLASRGLYDQWLAHQHPVSVPQPVMA